MTEDAIECCDDWDAQTKLIDSYIVFGAVHSGELDQFGKRGGKQFRFCPWCGKKRALQAAEEKGAY